MELFLGVDIGTGSSKGVITGINGKVLAEHSVPHETSMPKPGWFEQDADGVWWNDMVTITRALLKAGGIDPRNIKALGISTIAPCVLPVDDQGRPLRPGILYGIDTRAAEETGWLEKTIGKEKIFNTAGQNLSSQACCPKILWIKNHEPEIYRRTARFLTAAGYLVYKLTGRYTLDIYNAMAYGPLYDIRKQCWDDTYSEVITGISKLPELIWSTDIAGTVSPEAAKVLGLPQGVKVLCGTADAAAEAVSAGFHRDGDMMMMYESSNFFILKTAGLFPQESFWATYFVNPGTHVLTEA